MKRFYLLVVSILLAIGSYAQFGTIGNILIGSNTQNMQGKVFADLNVTYPISLSQVAGYTGNVKFPFSQIGIHYGVYQNMTIGLQVGYFSTSSSQARNFIDSLLGMTPQTVNSKFVTVGLKGSRYFKLGTTENVSIPLNIALGYRFITNEVENEQSQAQSIINSLISTYDAASKYYFSTTTGVVYDFPTAPISFSGEVGYGYGYGNDVFAGVNNLILTAGVRYRLK